MARRFLFLLSLSFVFAPVAQTSLAAQDAKLSPKKMPAVSVIDERFQSYNIEMLEVTGGRFWAPYNAQGAPPAAADAGSTDTGSTGAAVPGPGGMPASLYRYRAPIDLSNAKLRKLAAALGPAYVRVSGTWANSTFFSDSDEAAPATPPTGFGGVLTRPQWHGVVDFSHAVDAKIVTSFAVSQGVRDASGVWTPVEATKLLNYTKSIGGNIAAAELFNEPTFASLGGAPKGYDAAAYGRDFRAFYAFTDKAAPDMKILGPGSIGEAGGLGTPPGMTMLKSEDMLAAEGPGLDIFTYHFYGGVSKRCSMMGPVPKVRAEDALTDDWLARTDRDETFYARLRDKFAPGKPIWLTETGETACGGDPWASDFIDTFRYLNQLGSLAKHGVRVVMHNTLAASDYALIDEATLTPRPNYWGAVLWRRLMGTVVLDAGRKVAPTVYTYAHCLRGTPGGVAVLAINASRSEEQDIVIPDRSSRFTLSAADLLDSKVQLNGVELKLTADDDVPAINGAPEDSGVITLAPKTITFFAIPGAKNRACY